MFSIIVPTHGRPALLSRTLRSLIAQTYKKFQVIIIDDVASHVPPYEELFALQGHYTYVIRSGVAGPGESRNMGLKLAQSEYILFLDDDDTFEPGHLEALANCITRTSPELLFCDFTVRHEDRTQSPPRPISLDTVSIADVTLESVFVINRIPNSCIAFRADVVASKNYDNTMVIYEDWDFLLECLQGRKLLHLPINTVNIHKSLADAPENLRRGNTHDELIVKVMLHLYKKFPGMNLSVKQARQALMKSAGVYISIESC